MKRFPAILLICLLFAALACAKAPAPAEAPAASVPETADVKLTLPIGTRNDVLKTLPAYTAGFTTESGETPAFSVVSADPSVAEGLLKDDGALCVIAHGTGETKLTVTAKTASGEEHASTVSVTVRDARRMLVLIVLGVLSVALLVFLGKPSASKTRETPAARTPENNPNDNPERS